MILLLVLIIVFAALQPICLPLAFALRFLWHPPALSERMIEAQHRRDGGHDPVAALSDAYSIAESALDKAYLRKHWDAGKFWSMYAWATGDDLAWKTCMQMADTEAGTLHRNPEQYWKPEEITFSGDQLSGFMGAVVNRFVTRGLTGEEAGQLASVWDRVSFDGWPMLFPHYKDGKRFERGFVWRPWQVWNSASLIKLLVWLALGAVVTGKRRYSVLYYIVLTLYFPTLMLASPDGEAWIGKLYACSANASHSLMLDCVSGYRLNKSFMFKRAMKWLIRKRGTWSPDCLALWGAYFGRLTEDQEALLAFLVESTLDKCLEYEGVLGTSKPVDPAELTAKQEELRIVMCSDYYDVLHFEKHRGYKYIYPPAVRGCDYSDERHLAVSENWWRAVPCSKTAVDVIFPAGVYLHSLA